jgi:hypothetical protein
MGYKCYLGFMRFSDILKFQESIRTEKFLQHLYGVGL